MNLGQNSEQFVSCLFGKSFKTALSIFVRQAEYESAKDYVAISQNLAINGGAFAARSRTNDDLIAFFKFGNEFVEVGNGSSLIHVAEKNYLARALGCSGHNTGSFALMRIGDNFESGMRFGKF